MRTSFLRAIPALVLAGAALAGCGGGGAAPAAPSTTTTSTTTTTLPGSISIAATNPKGPLSFLGPVQRVSVVQPVAGGVDLPPQPTTLGAHLPATRIAYRRFGSGPNLLLVMGEHGTMTWWDPQVLSDLQQHYTVTIFDLPGLGYSESPPTPPTIDTYADDTAGLAVALGLQQQGVILIGWGLGGTVALDAQARHPGLSSALVLVDPLAPGVLYAPPAGSVTKELASPTATITGLSRLLFDSSAEALRTEWLARVFQAEPDDATAGAVAAEAAVTASIHTETTLAGALRQLAVPVRIFSGSDDKVVPPANATGLAHAIPGARLIQIPAAYDSVFQDVARLDEALTTLESAVKTSGS